MVSLLNTDIFLTSFINGYLPHNRFFNLFFSFFSLKASSLPIWAVIIIFLLIFEEKINKKFIIYLVISLAITSIIVLGLKNIVRRPRPTIIVGNHITTCDKDFSFPSGHASIAFACAAVLAAFDKKRKWFYFLIAGLIALSRIYLHCHYFSDVLIGGLLGYFISKSTILLSGAALHLPPQSRSKPT